MGTKYGLKLVWPDWPERKDFDKTIGFSEGKEKFAKEFQPGDKMLVYATSPTMKIIAEIEVTKTYEDCIKEGLKSTKSHELPVGTKVTYGPVPGITLEAAGINFKPTKGITYVPLGKEIYNKALSRLKQAY